MGFRSGQHRSGGGTEFPQAPVGSHVAVCSAYYPAGVHEVEWIGEVKDSPKVCLVYEIEAQDPNGNRFQLVECLTDSMFKSAQLKQRAAALLGRAITKEEEEDGIDLDMLLNRACMVYVAESDRGRSYVESVERLQDQSKAFAPVCSYEEMPGLVKFWMKKAKPNTINGWMGFVDQGVAAFVPLSDSDKASLGDRILKDEEPATDGGPVDGEPF
jgi:hypothetical protein